MYKPIILGIAMMALFVGGSPSPAFAGWSENIRITYRGNEINPQVIARNDTVHVAWNQIYGHVSYIRSTDGGATWDSLVNLTQPMHTGQYANLNLGENGVLISWLDDNDDENITSIALATSSDGGVWNPPIYYWTDNPNRFGNPVSAVNGDSIFLVYYSHRNDSTGSLPLRAIHSYDYGQTWSDEVTVAHPISLIPQPIRLLYCSGALLAMWAGAPDSSHLNLFNINGYRSIDAGRNWAGPIWVSPINQFGSQDACAACNRTTGELAAGYMDYRFYQYAFHGDIFASISEDGGLTWPFETMASTPHTAWFPSIDYLQDTLVAVWSDMRYYQNVSHEIVFNRSNDGGMVWLGEYRLTETIDESYFPWTSIDSGKISVVWYENPEGSIPVGIYYKKYTPDETRAEEAAPTMDMPISIAACPNPFNGQLQIEINSNAAGHLAIYDIQGKLINEFGYLDGETSLTWNGHDKAGKLVSSGTYFLQAIGGEAKKRIRVVYMK